MLLCRITPATVSVTNHKDLLAAWKTYGRILVGAYRCEEQLTASQLRKLPRDLAELLKQAELSEQS